MPTSPCKDCDKRFIGCHGSCDDYKVFRTELDRINQLKEEDYVKHFWKVCIIPRKVTGAARISSKKLKDS